MLDDVFEKEVEFLMTIGYTKEQATAYKLQQQQQQQQTSYDNNHGNKQQQQQQQTLFDNNHGNNNTNYSFDNKVIFMLFLIFFFY